MTGSRFEIQIIQVFAILAVLAKIGIYRRMDHPEAAMRRFSLTDLSNRSGEVIEAAYSGPVEITRRGKRRFIIMTSELYDRLRRADDPRRVYGAGETPADLAEAFGADIGRLAEGDGYEE